MLTSTNLSQILEPVAPGGRRPQAFEVVAGTLKDAILSGRLAAGERLPTEPELAAHFGVGRSSVREAIRALASQHLVFVVRGINGGTYVAHPDADQVSSWIRDNLRLLSAQGGCDVRGVMDVRRMLEIPAVEHAAESGTAEIVERLEVSVASLEGIDGLPRAERLERHIAFHKIIVEASENVLLRVMAMPLFFVLRDRLSAPEPSADFWKCTRVDHEAILLAVRDGDRALAGQAMARHLDNLEASYTELDRLNAGG